MFRWNEDRIIQHRLMTCLATNIAQKEKQYTSKKGRNLPVERNFSRRIVKIVCFDAQNEIWTAPREKWGVRRQNRKSEERFDESEPTRVVIGINLKASAAVALFDKKKKKGKSETVSDFAVAIINSSLTTLDTPGSVSNRLIGSIDHNN